MKTAAKFDKSLMAFANLFTVLIFFQAAWQDTNVNVAVIGGIVWLASHTIALALIAYANKQERAI